MLLLYCVSSGRLRQANFTQKRDIRRCKVSRIIKMIYFGIIIYVHTLCKSFQKLKKGK